MNKKRFTFSVIAGFIFIFVFEFILHGILLESAYEATSDLWRAPEKMEEFFPFMLLSQIAMTLVICFIFTRHYEGKGIGEGIRFGTMIGLLVGVLSAATYVYLPISLGLALAWFGGSFVEMIGLGIVFSLIYKK